VVEEEEENHHLGYGSLVTTELLNVFSISSEEYKDKIMALLASISQSSAPLRTAAVGLFSFLISYPYLNFGIPSNMVDVVQAPQSDEPSLRVSLIERIMSV